MIYKKSLLTDLNSLFIRRKYFGGSHNSFDWRSIVMANKERFELGNNNRFGPNSIISVDTGFLKIGNNFQMSANATIACYGGKIEIGDNCSLNPYSILYGHGNLKIGNFVRIAAHATIIPANHNFNDKNLPITKQGLSKKGIIIEDDCWIGAGVTILDGVKIGKGTVVAAGAVVNENVPSYSIVGGVPARLIKERS